jgi:SAM-dependent methyltransferase
MYKITTEFIIKQYQSGIENYKYLTLLVGLWESEKYVFNKYLDKSFQILDIGCGTGRTTFGLYKIGYTNIIGVDLTPEMINAAKEINRNFSPRLKFLIGDATNLSFENERFDAAIFSFNGLMSIPQPENRLKAFKEINRVLRPDGIFIFTTHDRESDEKYLQFWIDEKKKWDEGKQRSDLYQFGDLITTSKNEKGEIFIHIPDQQEVLDLLDKSCFKVIETFYRLDKFEEPEKVKEKSAECRFWIVEKT